MYLLKAVTNSNPKTEGGRVGVSVCESEREQRKMRERERERERVWLAMMGPKFMTTAVRNIPQDYV